VIEHFGYRDVNALRTALFRFPDDPIIKAAFYGKVFCYNKLALMIRSFLQLNITKLLKDKLIKVNVLVMLISILQMVNLRVSFHKLPMTSHY
jgi:hypothetical protein